MANVGGLEFLLTVVYASNKERKQPWEGLISASELIGNLPWVALGGLNEITCPEERIGTRVYTHGGPSEFLQAT